MKHHIMNILKVYGRSLKRNNIIVIISFSTHLAFNICICYNPVFDSLLSIKTAVDQYLWVFQRFCLLF